MTVESITNEKIRVAADQSYSVEYFHVYTDDTISNIHTGSLDKLNTIKLALRECAQPIVMIDNYNPTEDTLSAEQVFEYLEEQGASPEYWAYEADLVESAKTLLDSMTDSRLEKSYRKYIEKNDKFPCSLLTATWYLMRLGAMDATGVIRSRQYADKSFSPSDALINILPEAYGRVEERACSIISGSKYAHLASKIHYVFYETEDFSKPNAQ